MSNQREQEKKEEEKLRDSKCFYKNAQNKIDCVSIDSTGCLIFGILACKVDTDCPFFEPKGKY